MMFWCLCDSNEICMSKNTQQCTKFCQTDYKITVKTYRMVTSLDADKYYTFQNKNNPNIR